MLLLLSLAIVFTKAIALPPPPASCAGTINSRPLTDGDAAPIVNTTSNGSTKRVISANLTAPLLLLHVYGGVYEMNFAVGELLSEEIAAAVPAALAYLYAQVNASYNLSWLPEPVRDWVVEYGVETALDWTANATAPYTPSHWVDALRGLADGSGSSIVDLRRVAMIAEWTRAQCSMLGAWGAASFTGFLTQLRALDWDTDGPFQQWPTLIVYHPDAASGGVPNAVLGWAGMLGAITGVSSAGVGISEKVWDAYQGSWNAFGYSWNYLLADALMFDKDTDQVLSRIATANRTCAIWIGVGDAHGNGGGGSFKAVAYSSQLVSIFNDVNYPSYVRILPRENLDDPRLRRHPSRTPPPPCTPNQQPNHDLFKNLVFINKHVQPSSEPCMNDLLHSIYSSVTGLATLQYVTALEQTGDMHIMVIDFGADKVYVANASPDGTELAYDATFVEFTMSALWAEPARVALGDL